jgi:uncharacterized RDD family membrane protein YckC
MLDLDHERMQRGAGAMKLAQTALPANGWNTRSIPVSQALRRDKHRQSIKRNHLSCAVALMLYAVLGAAAPWSAFAQPADIAVEAVEQEPLTTNLSPSASRPQSMSRRSRASYEDVIQYGSDVTISEGQHVREVTIVAGDVQIDGAVHGDLTVVLGNVRLGPKAQISRDVTVVLGVLEADPAATIRGERTVIGLDLDPRLRPLAEQGIRWFKSGPLLGRPLPLLHGWSWLVMGLFLLIYALLALLFPGALNAGTAKLQTDPGRSFLVGLLVTFLFLPFLLVLSITVVGLVLVPILICAMAATFVFAKTVVYGFAGQQVGSQFGWNALHGPALAVLVGGALFCLVYTVPIIGALAWFAVAPLGIGAIVLVCADRFRREGAPVQPVIAAASELASPAAIPGTEAALLPRAGFWRRFMATLLDLMLIGFIVAMVSRGPKWFLPVWVLYHIAMWGWKGTTIGGIVLGLKIVRVDGSQLTFAVALVRSLASFFSAAVLFLGFFWAGWSRDRQAWHDRIAGTVIVKVPKGTPLI